MKLRSHSTVIPAIFIGIVLFISGMMWHMLRPPTLVIAPTDAVLKQYKDCLDEGEKKLDFKTVRDCEAKVNAQIPADDYVKSKLEELRWLLGLIAALAALFSIAQGAAALFNAQNANKAIEDAIKTLEERKASIAAQYPLFEDVQKKRDTAYERLRTTLQAPFGPENPNVSSVQALQYLEDFYATMPVSRREEILSVESFISLDLNPGAVPSSEYTQMLMRLALFYHSKFLYEETFKRGLIGDLERAEAYLLMICELDRQDFKTLNELGLLYMTFSELQVPANKDRYAKQADGLFQDSLRKNSDQQRAHFNRSVLSTGQSDPAGEFKHLLEAEKQKNWQDIPVPFMKGFIYFNLACSVGRSLGKDGKSVSEGDAAAFFEYLNKASQNCRFHEKTVEKEFLSGGDFLGIWEHGSPEVKSRLEALRSELKQPPPIKKGFVSSLSEAWVAFREARHPRS
jgi:hypothetical protein